MQTHYQPKVFFIPLVFASIIIGCNVGKPSYLNLNTAPPANAISLQKD